MAGKHYVGEYIAPKNIEDAEIIIKDKCDYIEYRTEYGIEQERYAYARQFAYHSIMEHGETLYRPSNTVPWRIIYALRSGRLGLIEAILLDYDGCGPWDDTDEQGNVIEHYNGDIASLSSLIFEAQDDAMKVILCVPEHLYRTYNAADNDADEYERRTHGGKIWSIGTMGGDINLSFPIRTADYGGNVNDVSRYGNEIKFMHFATDKYCDYVKQYMDFMEHHSEEEQRTITYGSSNLDTSCLDGIDFCVEEEGRYQVKAYQEQLIAYEILRYIDNFKDEIYDPDVSDTTLCAIIDGICDLLSKKSE